MQGSAPDISALHPRRTSLIGMSTGPLYPDVMRPNQRGPKGFRNLPIGIDGLYLSAAGCHGGPGITFIPGCNAGYQVLDDIGSR